MKRCILLFFAGLLLAGCSSEISVIEAERHEYFSIEAIKGGHGLLPSSSNILANYLLLEDYENNPEQLLMKMRSIFVREPRSEYLAVLADASLNFGYRYSSKNPELASRYFLSAAVFSYAYLSYLDHPEEEPYSADRVQIIQIYNQAVSEFFDFLSKRNLTRSNSYTLSSALDARITFRPVEYKLPLKQTEYESFLLCSNYQTKNLTHNSRHFGIGAPLICELVSKGDVQYAKDQMLPATLVIHFKFSTDFSKVDAHLQYIDPRNTEYVQIGKHKIPLSMDFSTPAAYMAKRPLPFGILGYMLYPERTKVMQGLYQFEPFNENRIPVVLVHGLMSNTRTWIQMLNTLQHDPIIRKHYQFWGFSYSSGNPILFSAKMLRTALANKRAELIKEGKSVENFDRMVLVGHSMGGLLSKTTIMDTNGRLLDGIATKIPEINKLTPEQRKIIGNKGLDFKHLPFVKRVIFIAVPHGGSGFATSFIGRLGSALIQLPRDALADLNKMIKDVFAKEKPTIATGIDNLAPDSIALLALKKIPFVKGIPYHSIIGNQEAAGVPAGSDGIVPYTSSHLDGVTSELVVKSGHSAQQNPLGIQEVRRILLEHLSQYKNVKADLKSLIHTANGTKKNERK
ncbi:MAG: hypothetical protein IKB16_08210 [Lentisphaeria bacterium]|nr:hypothetical protein [Lentisphaeria bacterium]